MEPRERIELSTCRLRIGCSTLRCLGPAEFTIASQENDVD